MIEFVGVLLVKFQLSSDLKLSSVAISLVRVILKVFSGRDRRLGRFVANEVLKLPRCINRPSYTQVYATFFLFEILHYAADFIVDETGCMPFTFTQVLSAT